VEDPDVENTEPFFEGDHGVTYAFTSMVIE
jgi:hypothetical protein